MRQTLGKARALFQRRSRKRIQTKKEEKREGALQKERPHKTRKTTEILTTIRHEAAARAAQGAKEKIKATPLPSYERM